MKVMKICTREAIALVPYQVVIRFSIKFFMMFHILWGDKISFFGYAKQTFKQIINFEFVVLSNNPTSVS